MSFLSKVTRGPVKKPLLILIHGSPGVGKSTFAADFPSPIFLGSEDGTDHIDVARLPELRSFKDIMSALGELRTQPHDFRTLVIDSIDWLEPVIFSSVCEEAGVDSIEDAFKGYGRGYAAALEKWRELMAQLSALRSERKMNVVAIAHSTVKRLDDVATGKQYDRVTLKLQEKASALWQEFVDAVLFATFDVKTLEEGSKTRAFNAGRIIISEFSPHVVAKNRFGIPSRLPLSAEAFFQAVEVGQPESPEILKRQIGELLAVMKDQTLVATVKDHVGKVGSDPIALSKALNRLQTIQTR